MLPLSFTSVTATVLIVHTITLFFKLSLIYIFISGDLEVDGIICISGSRESEQIVVKVHEKLYKSNKLENDAEDIEKPGECL